MSLDAVGEIAARAEAKSQARLEALRATRKREATPQAAGGEPDPEPQAKSELTQGREDNVDRVYNSARRQIRFELAELRKIDLADLADAQRKFRSQFTPERLSADVEKTVEDCRVYPDVTALVAQRQSEVDALLETYTREYQTLEPQIISGSSTGRTPQPPGSGQAEQERERLQRFYDNAETAFDDVQGVIDDSRDLTEELKQKIVWLRSNWPDRAPQEFDARDNVLFARLAVMEHRLSGYRLDTGLTDAAERSRLQGFYDNAKIVFDEVETAIDSNREVSADLRRRFDETKNSWPPRTPEFDPVEQRAWARGHYLEQILERYSPRVDNTSAGGGASAVASADLETLRSAYIKVQKQLHDVSGIKTVFAWMRPGSKKTAQEALAKAEKEYSQKRAEFVGADVLRHMQERNKEVEERLALYKMQKENGDGVEKYTNKARRMWDTYKKSSARKYISTAGAVGAAFALFGGMPVAGVIGAGYLGLRTITAATSGIGTYDFLNMARGWGAKKLGPTEYTPSSIRKYIEAMEVRAGMDGKTLADLQNDQDYTGMVRKYEGFVEGGDLQNAWKQEQETLGKKLGQERVIRLGTAVGAGVINYFALHRVIGAWEKWQQANEAISTVKETAKAVTSTTLAEAPQTPPAVDSTQAPETTAPKQVSVAGGSGTDTKPDSQAGLNVAQGETAQDATAAEQADSQAPAGEGTEGFLTVDKTGIEGTLLHFKDQDPEQYNRMIDWLKSQDYNQGIDDHGKLVHRFVSHYAEENGFNIDQGGSNDLSKIFGGEIHIHEDGSITFDSQPDFIPDSAPRIPALDADVEETEPAEAIEATAPEPSDTVVSETPTDTTAAETEPAGVAKTLAEAREEAAISLIEKPSGKLSDSLQLLLDKDYKVFTKERFGVNPESLNSFKNLSVNEFLQKVENGKIDARKFIKLYRFVSFFKTHPTTDMDLNANKGFAKLIFGSAKIWKQNRIGL